MPCLLKDQNFTNNFLKGSPKEYFYEIISKSDKRFQRRRISLKSTQCKKPPSIAAMFFRRIKISQTLFEKAHPRNNPVKLFQNLFYSFWLPWQPDSWQPDLWLEFNLLNNFGRASPKEHPCQVSSRLAQWFRRRKCLKKSWTMDDT